MAELISSLDSALNDSASPLMENIGWSNSFYGAAPTRASSCGPVFYREDWPYENPGDSFIGGLWLRGALHLSEGYYPLNLDNTMEDLSWESSLLASSIDQRELTDIKSGKVIEEHAFEDVELLHNSAKDTSDGSDARRSVASVIDTQGEGDSETAQRHTSEEMGKEALSQGGFVQLVEKSYYSDEEKRVTVSEQEVAGAVPKGEYSESPYCPSEALIELQQKYLHLQDQIAAITAQNDRYAALISSSAEEFHAKEREWANREKEYIDSQKVFFEKSSQMEWEASERLRLLNRLNVLSENLSFAVAVKEEYRSALKRLLLLTQAKIDCLLKDSKDVIKVLASRWLADELQLQLTGWGIQWTLASQYAVSLAKPTVPAEAREALPGTESTKAEAEPNHQSEGPMPASVLGLKADAASLMHCSEASTNLSSDLADVVASKGNATGIFLKPNSCGLSKEEERQAALGLPNFKIGLPYSNKGKSLLPKTPSRVRSMIPRGSNAHSKTNSLKEMCLNKNPLTKKEGEALKDEKLLKSKEGKRSVGPFISARPFFSAVGSVEKKTISPKCESSKKTSQNHVFSTPTPPNAPKLSSESSIRPQLSLVKPQNVVKRAAPQPTIHNGVARTFVPYPRKHFTASLCTSFNTERLETKAQRREFVTEFIQYSQSGGMATPIQAFHLDTYDASMPSYRDTEKSDLYTAEALPVVEDSPIEAMVPVEAHCAALCLPYTSGIDALKDEENVVPLHLPRQTLFEAQKTVLASPPSDRNTVSVLHGPHSQASMNAPTLLQGTIEAASSTQHPLTGVCFSIASPSAHAAPHRPLCHPIAKDSVQTDNRHSTASSKPQKSLSYGQTHLYRKAPPLVSSSSHLTTQTTKPKPSLKTKHSLLPLPTLPLVEASLVHLCDNTPPTKKTTERIPHYSLHCLLGREKARDKRVHVQPQPPAVQPSTRRYTSWVV